MWVDVVLTLVVAGGLALWAALDDRLHGRPAEAAAGTREVLPRGLKHVAGPAPDHGGPTCRRSSRRGGVSARPSRS